jgi:hypothetical protein
MQVVSYFANRGQREYKLRSVQKMQICISYPLCTVSKRDTSASSIPQSVKHGNNGRWCNHGNQGLLFTVVKQCKLYSIVK